MEDISLEKILTLLQSEYPNSFANMDDRTKRIKLSLWKSEFGQDDHSLVYAAVRLYMKNPEKFAPTIGQIREKMNELTQAAAGTPEIPEQAAWALVSKACSNGLYGYREEFAKLPPDVQRAVGAPEQLKAWAMMDAEAVESVVASNFMRAYRTQQKRDKELALLPEELRARITGKAADALKLEAPK